MVYEAINGPDPRSPEEFARDYPVPLLRSSRPSTMWARISRSFSKSGTAKRPGSAHGAYRASAK